MSQYKFIYNFSVFLMTFVLFTGCDKSSVDESLILPTENIMTYSEETFVWDIINDRAFNDYGRLIFPIDKPLDQTLRVGELSRILTWYNYVNVDKTVEILNYFKTKVNEGAPIFYEIYTDEEKKSDPTKKDTGLFFFRGELGGKFAILNAGGGFSYVGAIHDSFPQALELSKLGYNAFALIYRPDANKACEDLARAIAFVHENAKTLDIDTADYSLWGGSAGARLAAWLGSYGTSAFGEKDYPKASAVILQYTGLSEVNGDEPPTYACVGTKDSIASYQTMQNRINKIKANGTSAEIDVFEGLPHGFGLGEGTIAEGWLVNAVVFWKKQMDKE